MSVLESLILAEVPSHSDDLLICKPSCSSADRVILPEDITENRKQWKQTAPGTLLSILAKAELSNASFIQLEEEIGRTSITANITRFSLSFYLSIISIKIPRSLNTQFCPVTPADIVKHICTQTDGLLVDYTQHLAIRY